MGERSFFPFLLAHCGKLNFPDVGSAGQGGGGEQGCAAAGLCCCGAVLQLPQPCRSLECSSRGIGPWGQADACAAINHREGGRVPCQQAKCALSPEQEHEGLLVCTADVPSVLPPVTCFATCSCVGTTCAIFYAFGKTLAPLQFFWIVM